MYRSLYQIIQPRVDARESGILKLLHASRQDGAVQLDKGSIVGLVQGAATGVEAAKIMVRWVNVAAMFIPGETMTLPLQKQLNTATILSQLKKIDPRIDLFKEMIGGCDAVFQFTGQQIAGTQQFTPQELNLSFLLDGRMALKEVQAKSDMAELDLLLTLCKLIKTGLVKVVRPHQPMAVEKRTALLEQIENELSEITGPVASVIIADAFKAIGAPPEALAECDIAHLFSVITIHLEDDEREAFARWVEAYEKG